MAASANQPTLVLLHGLLGDAHDWQPVQAVLAGLPSLALDLPGHGSNQAVRVAGFEQAHRWLCDELAARDIGRYLLAGYSLGGGSPSITPARRRLGCRPCCWRTATPACHRQSGPPASPTMRAGPGASSRSPWRPCWPTGIGKGCSPIWVRMPAPAR
ncbi:alpha/beta fold hydrolase [Aeromonas hydrophila]